MGNWFECKVTYDRLMENGVQKKVTEPYLVDALSYTEAEARIIEEMKPFISGEFEVSNIRRMRLTELFFNDRGDRYYKAKVIFVTLDEKTGANKTTAVQMLAQASNIEEALSVVEEGMEGCMCDYEIVAISETMIVDIFPFTAEQ